MAEVLGEWGIAWFSGRTEGGGNFIMTQHAKSFKLIPPPSRDKYQLAPTQVLRIMGYHASRGKIPVYITGLLIFTPN